MSLRKLVAVVSLLALCPVLVRGQGFSFEYLESDLAPGIYGSASWADANGDGRMDVLITGNAVSEQPYAPASTLYLSGEIIDPDLGTRQSFTPLSLPIGLWHSASAWSDFDRDGDPDVVVLGAANTERPYVGRTLLLANDGNGGLTPVDAGLPGLYAGSAEWGDLDRDGDNDLLLTGISDDGYATLLLRNDGVNTFTRLDRGLPAVGYGCARFGDYDGDGDLDVVVTGQSADGYITRIYRNDDGAFYDIGLDPSLALVYSDAAWGDADDDGDLDLLLTGGVLDERLYSGRTYLVFNRGNDNFERTVLDVEGMVAGSVAWGDVDLDGDLDAFVNGAYFLDGPRAARVYFNNDPGFAARLNLVGTVLGETALADREYDGDLDLVSTGISAASTDVASLYVNVQNAVNDPPAPPADLQASVNGRSVDFSWSEPRDDWSERLTYAIRIGTSPEGVDVSSPDSDPATGARYVSGAGRIIRNAWRVTNLAPGTYWWSVQAIDGAFSGSEFSEPQSFTIQ